VIDIFDFTYFLAKLIMRLKMDGLMFQLCDWDYIPIFVEINQNKPVS